jgi:hypothetical protein
MNTLLGGITSYTLRCQSLSHWFYSNNPLTLQPSSVQNLYIMHRILMSSWCFSYCSWNSICCNPPVHDFTGHAKRLTDPQQTNTWACYVFAYVRTSKFLWTLHFDKRFVCKPTTYLVMWESQSVELFGLQQIAISWAIFLSLLYLLLRLICGWFLCTFINSSHVWYI